ncbi:MAG: TIGR03790 family protein [Verrucomicrobiota bacterium]
MFVAVVLWLLLLGWLKPAVARADSGDDVVVLYNSRLPESKAVAEHYAEARQVPASHLFGFALTTNEVMSRADFRDFLQAQLAADLVEAKLWKFGNVTIPADAHTPRHTEKRVVTSKIRYAVLCWGMPLKIAQDDTVQDPGPRATNNEFARNEAAVDSELAWLPWFKAKVRLGGPMSNPLYACTNRAQLTPTNGLLLVARLDGPTPEIANSLVDKAMAAESNGLWGRAYFDARGLKPGDPYFLGDQWILAGAEICRFKGFDVETDTNSETFSESFPMSQIAIYAGWYDWNVSGPFARPTVEFMPGAFAYHLQSFSADTLRSTTQNWCGPLLAKGATCTMGCVYEPFLQFTPNIAFFLEAFLGGYSFGEAAWVSQPALSWQTTVIGDPLYRPFRKSPQELHAQLTQDQNPLIEWSWNRVVNLDLVKGLRASRLASFLEDLPVTDQSAVLMEKLAELDDLSGKPDSAIESWQRALTLHPTPQQRIRIRRTLAEKLVEAGRTAEAADDWRQLMIEAPDYPGLPSVHKKLQELEPTNAPTGNK